MRASDSRIVISLIIDGACVTGIYFMIENTLEKERLSRSNLPLLNDEEDGYTGIIMVCGLLALITSHNFMHTLCLNKPFTARNELLEKQ